MPDDNPPVQLGVRLGPSIRAARGTLSQTALAALIGTDQGTISKWEHDLQRPSLEELAAIEDGADQPRGFILTRAGYLRVTTSARDAILLDPELSDERRAVLLGAYDLSDPERRRKRR